MNATKPEGSGCSALAARYVDLDADKPMYAKLRSGEIISLTVGRGRNRKHKNRVRLVSPAIVQVSNAIEKLLTANHPTA